MSGREVIENLTALSAGKRPPAVGRILSAIRSRESFSLVDTEVDQILGRLDVIDREWTARLSIVVKQLPRRGGSAARLLSENLVREARRRSDYPPDQGNDEQVGQWALAWVRDRASVGPAQLPAPLLAVALYPARRQPFYVEALMVCLEAWAASSRQLYEIARFEAAALELLGAGKSGQQRGKATIAIAAYPERLRARLGADLEALSARADRLQSQLLESERQRSDISVRETELRVANDALRQEVAGLGHELDSSLLEANTAARNTTGRLRSSVASVLELETAQIRAYLDRAEPNVDGALASLEHIERLRTTLVEGG